MPEAEKIVQPVQRRTRAEMAERVAHDIPEGWIVNLGIGIPTQVCRFVQGKEVIFHSENGVLGFGPPSDDPRDHDPWLINAGKQPVSLLEGGCFFHHADSFAMIRGGHLDLCVLGAFEVSQGGDLANWTTSESDTAPAVGGAMDLAVGARNVWVVMEHTTREGQGRLVERCAYPLTAANCVTRVYTDLAVIDVTEKGFEVTEMVEGMTLQALQRLTPATLIDGRQPRPGK